jgi:aryl-alcohol dehydrogenase-like predicted oxidoreductase
MLGLASEQSIYNLLERTVELEVLPAAEAYGIGVIPWSPLRGGLLGGILRKQNEGRAAGERAQDLLSRHREQIERYEKWCEARGEHPADVGLAWLLTRPAVTAPIIGPRTKDQLDGNLRALDIELDDTALQELDQMFPGPGGTAPEAYAW